MTSIPALTALYKNISRLDDERRAEIPGSAKYADMSDLIGRLERQFDDGLRQAARRRRRETEAVRNEVVEALRREFAEGYARAKEIERQPVRTAAVARQHNESRLTGQSNSAVTAQAIGRSPAPVVVQQSDITTTPALAVP